MDSNSGHISNERFAYRNAARPPVTFDTLDFSRLSNMNETLTDLLYTNILLETSFDEAKLHDGNITIIKPDALPPPYVESVFGDVRATTSYFRGDRSREWPGVYPETKRGNDHGHGIYDAADLADTEHDMLRRVGVNLGRLFKKNVKGGYEFPMLPKEAIRARELTSDFFDLLGEYKKLLQDEGSDGQKNEGYYEKIPAEKLAEINARITATYDKLKEAYIALPDFPLTQEGKTYTVSNEKLPDTNSEVNKSYPLLVMFFLTTVGQMALDRDKYPAEALKHTLSVVGVSSQIIDVIGHLKNRIEGTGASLGKELSLNKEILRGDLEKDSRSLKLLYHFHRVLNRAYPAAFKDIEDRLKLIGQTPEVKTLETPNEMAVMLYATAKRLERDLASQQVQGMMHTSRLLNGEGSSTVKGLLDLAKNVADARDLHSACETVVASSPIIASAEDCAKKLTEVTGVDNHRTEGLQLVEATLLEHERNAGLNFHRLEGDIQACL